MNTVAWRSVNHNKQNKTVVKITKNQLINVILSSHNAFLSRHSVYTFVDEESAS